MQIYKPNTKWSKKNKPYSTSSPCLALSLSLFEDDGNNETVTANDLLLFLQEHGFDLFTDLWAENELYFGKRPNDVLDIDKMFGSKKFNIGSQVDLLSDSARRILQHPINASNFNHRHFLRSATDVIAIERGLSMKMKARWL